MSLSPTTFDRVIIVDPSLIDYGGHYYNYSTAVLRELRKRDFDSCIFANKELSGKLTDSQDILPVFSIGWPGRKAGISGKVYSFLQKLSIMSPKTLKLAIAKTVWLGRKIMSGKPKQENASVMLEECYYANNTLLNKAETAYFFHTINVQDLISIADHKPTYFPGKENHFKILIRYTEPSAVIKQKIKDTLINLYEHQIWPREITFYTDTNELAEAYNSLSPVRFECLPIPLLSEDFDTISNVAVDKKHNTLNLVYLGNARQEKGYPLLPDLAEFLKSDLEAGRIVIKHQCDMHVPEGEPSVIQAQQRLSKWPKEQIVALHGPLSRAEYFNELSNSDLILLPYDAHLYRERSSGILAEALALGIPVVAPRNTWLSTQIADKYGETFDSPSNFPLAVERAISNIDILKKNCEDHREEWRTHHSAVNLVETLLSPQAEDRT